MFSTQRRGTESRPCSAPVSFNGGGFSPARPEIDVAPRTEKVQREAIFITKILFELCQSVRPTPWQPYHPVPPSIGGWEEIHPSIIFFLLLVETGFIVPAITKGPSFIGGPVSLLKVGSTPAISATSSLGPREQYERRIPPWRMEL